MAPFADARQAAQALREENLELAAELDAAGRARMAADDAEAAALQARMQADAAHAHAAAAEPPAPGDGGGGSGEQLQEYWEERALALQERCGQLEAANSHLQTQVCSAAKACTPNTSLQHLPDTVWPTPMLCRQTFLSSI